jgi:hypothetical protein
MPNPITFTAYSVVDGQPLAGLTPAVTAQRRNSNGTYTALNSRTAADKGSGDYEIQFTDLEVPAGTLARYHVDLDGGAQLTTTRYLDGEVDGGAISIAAGTAVEVVPKGNGFADVRMKVGDTLPVLRQTLRNDAGAALDLTGATVQFRMREPGQALKVNAAAAILDAPNGVVQYTWLSANTDTAGLFDAEWAVSYSSNVETVPANGYVKLLFTPKLT